MLCSCTRYSVCTSKMYENTCTEKLCPLLHSLRSTLCLLPDLIQYRITFSITVVVLRNQVGVSYLSLARSEHAAPGASSQRGRQQAGSASRQQPAQASSRKQAGSSEHAAPAGSSEQAALAVSTEQRAASRQQRADEPANSQ